MARMTAQEAAEWGKTLTFEKVWAMFGESAEQMKIVEEKQAEAAAQISKTSQELADLKVTVERVTADDGGLRQSMKDLNKTVERVTGNVDGLRQSMKDLNKTVERVSNNVGGLNRSVGELVETLIAARLWEK
ncbi:MAG: hypothetical protein LBU16_02410, partial [Treponema sp.]|nr:hypothetical protein [Treponema sp.]